MDKIDKKILSILQENSSLPLSTIAKRVDLSTTPCFNRIKKLEEDGVIKKRVAILDNNKVNLPIILKRIGLGKTIDKKFLIILSLNGLL